MKLMKYVLVLAVVLCATAKVSNATANLLFLGGGSSALALELGQAAFEIQTSPASCAWTWDNKAATYATASDDRTSPATVEKGNIWIVWTPGSGTCAAPAGTFNVYSYLTLDSVLGQRCYFMVNSSGTSGCVQNLTAPAGTAGVNLLSTADLTITDTALPAAIISAVNNQRYFVAGTDIRPEDGKFASKRMFTSCGTTLTREPFEATTYNTAGLGYQTAVTGVGTTIQSFFSTKSFHVLDFNISGTDPISGKAVRTYAVTTVGAQPILIAVNGASAGLAAASNISSSTLAKFFDGTLGRTTDLLGPTATSAVTTLVREPLSGTYNTMEYSAVNTVETRANKTTGISMDAGNCSGTVVNTNPLNIPSTNGKVTGAARKRVIGTGEMVSQILAGTATDQRIGFFFWSQANAAPFGTAACNTSTPLCKYLTVNGADPLQTTYTGGTVPTTAAELNNVTFANLNAGDYPIWSALRIVSTAAAVPAVNSLISSLDNLTVTKKDMVTVPNLKIWRSHFAITSIGITSPANGDCTGSVEAGGDAGGLTILRKADQDYCTDFGTTAGELDLND